MIKLLTHNDLDAIGCIVLAQLVFGKDNVNYVMCNHDEVNMNYSDYLKTEDYKNYDYCFITDIAVCDKLVERTNETFDVPNKYVHITDHHISCMELNKEDWIDVVVADENDIKQCGTSLFYKQLLGYDNLDASAIETPAVREFVEKIRRYDVWDWAVLDDVTSKQLNDLVGIIGENNFIEYWFNKLSDPKAIFEYEPIHISLLKMQQDKINDYIDKCEADMVEREIQGYKAGVVFAYKYQSELGNALAVRHPELDFIAMINVGGGVSLRTNKDNVNVSEIAAAFGGGGHAKASGMRVPEEVRDTVIKMIFQLND